MAGTTAQRVKEIEAELARRKAVPPQAATVDPTHATLPQGPAFDNTKMLNDAQPGLGDQAEKQARIRALEAEILRRKGGGTPPPPQANQYLATSPLPTGIEEIDMAGQTVYNRGFKMPTTSREVPGLDSLPVDHPTRIRADLAAQGVDFVSGAPAGLRAAEAQGTSISRLRAESVKQAIEKSGLVAPEGMDVLRYMPSLDQFFVLMPDKQEEGKFRYTAMDGSGIEMADLADAMDPEEILSLAGAVGATFLDPTKGVGRVFSLASKATNRSAAIRGWTGGIGGRLAGQAAEIGLTYMKTGAYPTVEELAQQGWDAVQIETFASVMGELGAKILKTGFTGAQSIGARVRGKELYEGTAEEVATANRNLRETKQDMTRVADALGREDMAVTRGTATHSIRDISQENFGQANASQSTKRQINELKARGDRAVQDYVDTVFAGDPKYFGDRAGTIIRANDAIGTHGQVAVVQTSDGMIHYQPKAMGADGQRAAMPGLGVKIKPENDYWQVRGAKLLSDETDLTGTGLGKEIYTAAAEEAQSYGKAFASDTDVSEDALHIWRSVDGNETFGKLKWNENVEPFTDGEGRQWLKSTDGNPVVMTEKPRMVTPVLLEEFKKVGRGESGKFQAAKEFHRFLRSPGRRELGQVVEEMATNPYIKQDVKEAILEDFERSVTVDGKFNEAAWEQWKDETGRVLEEVFTPEEMVHIRTKSSFEGLRRAVQANRGQTELSANALARNLGLDRSSVLLKDNKSIWTQMKARDQKSRQRALRILDSTGHGDAIRSIFKEELRTELALKIKGSNVQGYTKWLNENRDLIRDMTGTVYYNDLRTVGHILKRRSDRAMVTGTQAEANPTMMALTRVIFGPLSRAQRFFTAARRAQVRGGSSSIDEFITDPSKLRELLQLKVLPVGNRAAARFIQDTGLAEHLGYFGGEEFDADNEQHRAELARNVMLLLEEEDLNSDRP